MVKTILIRVIIEIWKGKEETYIKYENEKKIQNYLNTLDEGFEDSFVYLATDIIHGRLNSTNCLERLNQEVRGLEKVVRIFPNEDSAVRLVISPSAFGDQSSLISMRIGLHLLNCILEWNSENCTSKFHTILWTWLRKVYKMEKYIKNNKKIL